MSVSDIDPIREGMHLLGIAVATIDEHGHFLAADANVCAMLGRTERELIELSDLIACIAPADRQTAVGERAERRGRPPQAHDYALSLLASTGELIPTELAMVPTMWHDGTPAFLVVIHDLRQRRAREALAERYALLVEAMPVGVIIWDTNDVTDANDLVLVSANAAANAAVRFDLGARAGEKVSAIFKSDRPFENAGRILGMRDTGRIEHFADLIVGRRNSPLGIYRHSAVSLPGGVVANLLLDITTVRAEVQQRRQMLERLVDAGDEERRNLAMGVHDDPIQQIAAASLLVDALRRNPDTPQREDRMATVQTSLRTAMTSLRRLVFELSPPELVESGLEAALRSASDYLFAETETVASIDVELVHEPELAVQTAAFRIAAEALTNARRHALATRVTVRLSESAGAVQLAVTDDGIGFDERARTGHIGLRNMRERATSLGGSYELRSGPAGTTVTASLPLDGRSALDQVVIAAVELPPLLHSEIESIRDELESLRAANADERVRAERIQKRLTGLVAVWSVFDDLSLGLDEFLPAAARVVAEVFPDACGIRLASLDGEVLQRAASWHPIPEQLEFLDRYLFVDRPRGDSYGWVVYSSNRPLFVDDPARMWIADEAEARVHAPFEVHAALIVPIRLGLQSIGTITIARDVTERPLGNDNILPLQTIADHLGRAIAVRT